MALQTLVNLHLYDLMDVRDSLLLAFTLALHHLQTNSVPSVVQVSHQLRNNLLFVGQRALKSCQGVFVKVCQVHAS